MNNILRIIYEDMISQKYAGCPYPFFYLTTSLTWSRFRLIKKILPI